MKGWHKESHRHYLAAKGITTKRYFALNTNLYFKLKPKTKIVDKHSFEADEKGLTNQGITLSKFKEVPLVGTDAYEDYLWDNGFKTNPEHMYKTKEEYVEAQKVAKELRKKAKRRKNEKEFV